MRRSLARSVCAVSVCALLASLASGARAQEPVAPVEPPGVRGLDARCAEAASELWRGHAEEAEQLARDAIAEAPATPNERGARHSLARCHALVGRAILARDPRDRSQHAAADVALRRAWELEPSVDLVDDLVASRWLGVGAPPLPIPAHSRVDATPAESAALARVLAPDRRAQTLRESATARGPTYAIVLVSSSRDSREEVVVVACVGARCVAEPLFEAWTSQTERESVGAAARIASVGFVPMSHRVAVVVAASTALEGERSGASARWRGSELYVRWLDHGVLEGWSLLSSSTRERWDAALGEGPPRRATVGVRWDGRAVVVLPSAAIAGRLRAVRGRRDPATLACRGCWLGGLEPGDVRWSSLDALDRARR